MPGCAGSAIPHPGEAATVVSGSTTLNSVEALAVVQIYDVREFWWRCWDLVFESFDDSAMKPFFSAFFIAGLILACATAGPESIGGVMCRCCLNASCNTAAALSDAALALV